MALTFWIGLTTTLVSALLTFLIFRRYRLRHTTHLLFWGIGLALYVVSGICEIVLAFGWHDLAFRLWYWSGALMIPPVLGQGTMHLLVRRKDTAWGFTLAVLVVGLSALVWIMSVPLDASKFAQTNNVAKFLTESYREIIPTSGVRRILPPIMNGYGTMLLGGGAAYSAYLFLRKQIMPNRVMGNVFIALGGLLPAFGGALVKFAEDTPALSSVGAAIKYIGILASAILLFIGFQMAINPPKSNSNT
jgi:hypothetical protein